MIAEFVTRRNAKIYAGELARHYGPDVHFDVVGLPDPVFGDTVWYVLGTGTVDGRIFAQYAQERKEWCKAAAAMENISHPRAATKEIPNEYIPFSQSKIRLLPEGDQPKANA